MDKEYEAQHIALKTLKQRCEYLQQKLDLVEEENCKLKMECKEYNSKSSRTSSGSSALEKQVVLLNHQKEQLSQQIEMITNENQTLWSHLSKLMPASENLGNKLSISTTQFSNDDLKLGNYGSSINLDSNDVLGDCSKESLEEISLKLINGILMGKTELENQYSEMIDLQKDSNVVNNKNVSRFVIQPDNRAAMNCIKEYVQKLKDFKEILNKQKCELASAITNMKNLKSIPGSSNGINNGDWSKLASMKFFNRDNVNNEESDGGKARVREDNISGEMICPMCGEGFQGSFTDFYHHVSEHFEDDSEEYVDASANFEMLP